ncbi:MAG: hypothetical protein J5I92_15180 [Thiogranum sp.]|nr:hypothetical protein [Thiogranum sp.]
MRKLTRTGWITAACAVATLALAITAVTIRSVEERILKEQRKTVNRIAEMEICLAAGNLKVVFDVLASTARDEKTVDGADIGFGFSTLAESKTIRAIEKLNLLDNRPARSEVGDDRPLKEFITTYATNFIAQTNMALAKYSTFLDRELILNATWLTNHNLVRRLAVTGEQANQVEKAGGETYPGLWSYERLGYSEVLSLLEEMLRMSGGNETGLVCETPEFFKRKGD